MNTENTEQPPENPLQTALFLPLAHWMAGLDYTFGYQLKLLQDFWGFTDAGH